MVNHSRMQPETDKWPAAGGALGLSNFTFVVWKNQVSPTAVDVDGVAEQRGRHGGTLDVPSRPPRSPGAVPGRLTGRGALPQHKIKRGLLMRVVRPVAPLIGHGQHLGRRNSAQLAILGPGFHVEINASTGLIGYSRSQ